jgi:hypothetical protein
VRRIAVLDSGFGRDLSCSSGEHGCERLIWSEQYCSAKRRDMDQYSASQGYLLSKEPKVNPITAFLAIGCVAIGAVFVTTGYLVPGAAR